MTSQDRSRQDHEDEQLRALLAQVDPEQGHAAQAPSHLLERVLASTDTDAPDDATSGTGRPAAPAGHPSFLARRWQAILLVAATVATLALAAPTVLPGLMSTGGGDATLSSADSAVPGAAGTEAAGTRAGDAAAEAPAAEPAPAEDQAAGSAASRAAADEATLVRTGSLLVGTDDPQAARTSFVATVLDMGGRVTSETVVTEASAGRAGPLAADELAAAYDPDQAMDSPWLPTGPGIWLRVEVPVSTHDDAMAAARGAGEVIALRQSSYDVGAQVTDVETRIEALRASLSRLAALMADAEDIADVIALEQAISQRQAELDSLRAQQRDLANQTEMSRIVLALMSPEDARATVDPPSQQSWWDSFLAGLGQLWTWLGGALLIASPLLLALGVLWWLRRRRTAPPVRG